MLQIAWDRCFADLGGARPPPCVWQNLQSRYREPHRAYHTLQHLEECFVWFEQARTLSEHPGEVALALFFHDAIYDTRASGNEERSAGLAGTIMTEYVRGARNPERITALIMATKHDAVPEGQDARLVVDIDLAILGAAPERFDEYERQVREEFDWVAPDAFRAGRRKVLAQFLARGSLFNLQFFKERLEVRARRNLARSLDRLN